MKRFNILFILLLVFNFSVFAQKTDRLWQQKSSVEKRVSKENVGPVKFQKYELDVDLLKSKLTKTSKRSSKLKKYNNIGFPNAKGVIENYDVFEASILSEELQNEFPSIKSYVGKGIENPSSIIRFSITKLGLHAMILKTAESTVYIDPVKSEKSFYKVYSKKDVPVTEAFQCKFDEYNSNIKQGKSVDVNAKTENANDGILRTYRLAIATTGEYSQFHLSQQGISAIATDDVKKEAVMNAIVVTMVRVNGIFERDLSLTMKLVADNKKIIFLDAATDGFTNDDSDKLIDESQTVIDANIGFSNYDIGHTFSTGGGGLATLNSPCTTSKAKGITGSSKPIGDSYYIDFVAHEMGHQFGAHHTFNGDASNCSGENRYDATAVEPGSGSTIMSYAGICTPQNVQLQSDDYFHLISIKEMWANISVGNSTCALQSTTGNNAPVIEDLINYTVPISTPFVLDAKATDADGDILTYTWEQLDAEIAKLPLVSTETGGPAFRSFGPSESSKRYFPQVDSLKVGVSPAWEVLPSVARTMRFGVNVRDNNTSGGQTTSAETILTVEADSGPFKITSQEIATNWDAGTAQTITWDIANTNIAPINCLFVNILLSTDGGGTYPITLASKVENNGSYEIVVPKETTSTARIKVESVGNVFYAINKEDIGIQSSEFIMSFDSYMKAVCAPDAAVYSITYNTFLKFSEVTTFSAEGLPTGVIASFNPTTATDDNTSVEMTLSGIGVANIGGYTIIVRGQSASANKSTVVKLDVFSTTINPPTLLFPEDNSSKILKPHKLTWSIDDNALEYDVEIALDNTFSTLIEKKTVNVNLYNPQLLASNTTYFWRVKSRNDCGESTFSTIFNFTTENEVCDSYNSVDTPIDIPDNTTSGINSLINIKSNKKIISVSVTVNITHTWMADMALKLISPKGTIIPLSFYNGGGTAGYINTVFDDNATTPISSGVFPFTGSFMPENSLSVLKDEESFGNWILNVSDAEAIDSGVINSWSVQICGIPIANNTNDSDNDGVVDVNDICPNTPVGSNVDEDGCPLFSLTSNNFTIKTIGETCPNKNNGQILISALESYNYTTTINSVVYNFTSEKTISNLSPGVYDFCIEVAEESYKQCFNVEIKEGATVSAKAKIASNKVLITIEQGTGPFNVFINKKEVLSTFLNSFTLNVTHGDLISVKTSVPCEGVFSKKINLVNDFTVYPNPTKGNVIIILPISEKIVTLEFYNMQSQLIKSGKYTVDNGKVQLSLEGSPTGLYFVKVLLKNPIILKILKQ